ncbi:MAG: hypothetical protein AAF449_10850, partial [Myxococcota bacterium]
MEATPPRSGRCLVCGKPLIGEQAYWITSPPDGEHHACRDWSKAPFPYDDDLRRLREAAQTYLRAYRMIVDVGCSLADIRRG